MDPLMLWRIRCTNTHTMQRTCNESRTNMQRIANKPATNRAANVKGEGSTMPLPALLNLCQRELFELAGVGVELADAVAELFDSHLILIVHPTERLFVKVNLRFGRGLSRFHGQSAFHFTAGLGHLIENIGPDRQQIAARQSGDLLDAAETRAHDLSLVAVLLEVVKNARDRL